MKQLVVLFCLSGFMCLLSCTPTAVDTAKQELLKAIADEQISADFTYTATTSDAGTTTVFRNDAVNEKLVLESRDTTILLGFYTERKKGEKAGTIYKSQLRLKDSVLTIEVTDLKGNLQDRVAYPTPQQVLKAPAPGGHDTIDECLDELFCQFEALRCEANKDCETKYYAVICCLNDGSCYSIHFFFPPTDPRCLFRPWPLDPPILVARM